MFNIKEIRKVIKELKQKETAELEEIKKIIKEIKQKTAELEEIILIKIYKKNI
jgi:DNA-binding transcriptional MerR regulator